MLEDISGEKIKEQFKSNNQLRLITVIVGGIIVIVLGGIALVALPFINKQAK